MKCAVLCNGPSRSAYNLETEYAFRIGCNIPWTKVDCTVILDPQLINVLVANPSLIDFNIYFCTDAWEHIKYINKESLFENRFLGTIVKIRKGLSSGNLACMKAIELGYKNIDIYGADSFTTNNIRSNTVRKSYTRNFLDSDSINMSGNWRTNFNKMVESYPEVKFNFIK